MRAQSWLHLVAVQAVEKIPQRVVVPRLVETLTPGYVGHVDVVGMVVGFVVAWRGIVGRINRAREIGAAAVAAVAPVVVPAAPDADAVEERHLDVGRRARVGVRAIGLANRVEKIRAGAVGDHADVGQARKRREFAPDCVTDATTVRV